MNIVSLVNHDVDVLNKKGELKVIKPSGKVARTNYDMKEFGEFDGIKVYRKDYRKINFDNVDIEPYTVYIVSNDVLNALEKLNHPLKHQFVAPNTSKAERDGEGNIVSVQGFLVL